MDRVFKSSIGALFRKFIVALFFTALAIFFIVGGVMIAFKIDRDVILAKYALIVYGIVAVVFAFYFSFIRHNISLHVTLNGVTFLKGKKAYLTFPRDRFFFTSYVQRSLTQMGIFTSRYLRSVDKKTNKKRDYRLYFSKKRFDEFIACVTALNDMEE